MVFRVYPIQPKIIKDINIDMGMANPTKSAFLNPRKNIKTVTTSMIPKIILFTKSSTCPMVFEDWSLVMFILRFEGKTLAFV